MFGGEIREHERVELDESMTILFRALARHLDDRVRATRIDRVAQKLLYEKTSGHRHLVEVPADRPIDSELDRRE